MNHVQWAPTRRAYLEQAAYGIISPNIVIIAVDAMRPVTPGGVISPIRIDKPELTDTFPNKIVHRSKFPLFRKGKIFKAYLASYSAALSLNGPLEISSRFLTSSPKRPKLSPENKPDIIERTTITIY